MTSTPVIVIAEQQVFDLLAASAVAWNVQTRVDSVAALWQGLSGGQLDAESRALVFSDTPAAGSGESTNDRAQAIVAMAGAGADVFVVVWNPAGVLDFRAAIDDAAMSQGLDSATLSITYLPVDNGSRALLEGMRTVLDGVVVFPDEYPQEVERFLTAVAPLGSNAAQPYAPAGISLAAPALPRLTIGDLQQDIPQGASSDLLGRPKLPGQVTITVTSSKGGSGKSTAAILLASSIAKAARDAGSPLTVCVVDMDTRDGQVASLIGKYMPTALNIRVQPVWDEQTIRRHLVREDSLGIDALLAPIRPRTADTVGPDFYRTIIRSLQRMYDVVVMDTSVQYLDPLIADVCLPEADEVLFITTLASTAVQGMARALREITTPTEESGLGIAREKIGIIVNQSVAGVGMQREQILAAGLGVPVVGVIPLATKDVLTATNLHRMDTLLDHPLVGPAYNELARACLPGRPLAVYEAALVEDAAPREDVPAEASGRKGLFRRG